MNIADGYSETLHCLPIKPENRKNTDKWFFYVFGSFITVLITLIIYTLVYSDINRYNRYDDCGNVCGQKNVKYEEWNCTGQDMTSKPFYTYFPSRCVSNYRSWYDFQSPLTYLKVFVVAVCRATCVPFAFALVVALFFRYETTFTTGVVLLACWVAFPGCAGYFWTFKYWSYYASSIIFFVFLTTVILCASIATTNKILQTVELLREATEAAFTSRNVIFNASMACISTAAILTAYILLAFGMRASGILTEKPPGVLQYIFDGYMRAAMYISFIMAFWMIQFVIGVASVTSSEAIAKRYYSRNQNGLVIKTTIRHHSATILLVSLLSLIVALPRAVLVVLGQISAFRDMMVFCLRYLDAFASRNTYILTALHGTPFVQSGKQAVRLSRSSIGNSETVRFYAHTLIVLSQFCVILASGFISCRDDFRFRSCFLLFPYSYIGTELVLGPIKVALNTIFFCICQDILLRRGTDQPHSISKEEYLEASRKLFSEKIKLAAT